MNIRELLEIPFPAFKDAYTLAAEAHKNDYRKDGKPYMTHIDAVIENTWMEMYGRFQAGWLDSMNASFVTTDYNAFSEVSAFLIVATYHDLFEDHPEYDVIKEIDKFEAQWPSHYAYRLADMKYALHRISKKEHGVKTYVKYSEYVDRVKRNKYSKIVKISDLSHNMSDLKPGQMYDKYELTLAVLKSEV
jgi:(p)ppGpp synthase/HD superfamily hydrolase